MACFCVITSLLCGTAGTNLSSLTSSSTTTTTTRRKHIEVINKRSRAEGGEQQMEEMARAEKSLYRSHATFTFSIVYEMHYHSIIRHGCNLSKMSSISVTLHITSLPLLHMITKSSEALLTTIIYVLLCYHLTQKNAGSRLARVSVYATSAIDRPFALPTLHTFRHFDFFRHCHIAHINFFFGP
jgi:hypothetical protein